VHLAANVHGLATGLMIRGLQTASAVSYDNDRGACLAAIVAVLGNLVRDAVAMGWRVFLGADATGAPLQAISALSFEVAGDAAPRGAGTLSAEMVIGEGARWGEFNVWYPLFLRHPRETGCSRNSIHYSNRPAPGPCWSKAGRAGRG
jgi:hypothetical protein